MLSEVFDVVRVESSDGIQDGVFDGLWSGYTVEWEMPAGTYKGKASRGVRGMNIPCTVTIKNARVSVEAKSA